MMSILTLVLLVVVLITAGIAAIGSVQASRRRDETLSRVRGADATLGAKVPLITQKDPGSSG